MGAISLVFNRDGKPLIPSTIEAINHRLSHRGPDGTTVKIFGSVAFAVQHLWATPEDVDSIQPIEDERYVFTFDGRIDNREELYPTSTMSDAQVAFNLYLKQGRFGLERIVGPFVLIIYDKFKQQVMVMRDHLGVRTLAYHLSRNLLVVASEPYACLAHPDLDDTYNDRMLARFLTLTAPAGGDTMFKQVNELLPAHTLTVTPSMSNIDRYWDVDPTIRAESSGKYAEVFRYLLEQSVKARLRATTPVTVALSGGYDSAAITALAAHNSKASCLRTTSWIFDHYPSCDERACSEAINRRFDLPYTQINADEHWPLAQTNLWPHDPNMPTQNPFRPAKTKMLSVTRRTGSKILLTGGKANQLFYSFQYWLVDLAKHGKWVKLIRRLLTFVQGKTPRELRWDSSMRAFARYITKRDEYRAKPLPDGISPYAANHIGEISTEVEGLPPSFYTTEHPHHINVVLSPAMAHDLAYEQRNTEMFGIDSRHPFADRRLVEWMLSLPAYVMFDGRQDKCLIYNGLKHDIPRKVLETRSRGDLTPKILVDMNKNRVSHQSLIQSPDSLWSTYLTRSTVENLLSKDLNTLTNREISLLWRITALELWRKQHDQHR